MSTLEKFDTTLQSGKASTEEALELFDALDPVHLEFMLGRWRGSGLHTNHPLDNFLEATSWYGKEFIDPDQVHPLLFLDSNNRIFKISPSPLVMNLGLHLPVLKSQAIKPVLRFMTSLLKTGASQARLRMMEYRQKVSATMIYDHLPIHDIFRKVDDNTVLGLMDFKGVPQPFFFVLRRDDTGFEPKI
jgi:Domain of unknown function (DUF4334)/GXWXG protein